MFAQNSWGKAARMLSIPALVLAFAMPLAATSADAARYKRLKLGAWTGGIYVNNNTGEFTHCVVSAKYKSGITLLFSVTKQQKWNIGFSKPNWKLERGKEYPVVYQVDRHRALSGKAFASNTKLVIVRLPGSTNLFNQMRRGRILRVKAGNDILSFNLTGTSKMLRSLLSCARRNQGLQVSPAVSAKKKDPSNPFATTTETKPVQKGNDGRRARIARQLHAEAKGWFGKHLADFSDQYRVIPNKGRAAKMYKKHSLVWQVGATPDIVGTLRIFTLKSPEKMEGTALAYEARSCKGDFASKFFKNGGSGGVQTNSLLATCRQEGKPTWKSYYVIMKRKAGGSYLATLLSTKASSEAVASAGDQLVGNLQTRGGLAPVGQPLEGDLPVRNPEATDAKEF